MGLNPAKTTNYYLKRPNNDPTHNISTSIHDTEALQSRYRRYFAEERKNNRVTGVTRVTQSIKIKNIFNACNACYACYATFTASKSTVTRV